MHSAPEPRCTNDDSKSFGFLYPPQHNLSECYHQTQYKRTRRCKKRNEYSITMHTASEPRCTHDDSKSFGFLYPPQHNHSECYHQTQYKRTRRCKKRNEYSITMHSASEPRCTHDDSKSFGFLSTPQHNHSGCYHQTQYKRTRRCKKRNDITLQLSQLIQLTVQLIQLIFNLSNSSNLHSNLANSSNLQYNLANSSNSSST